MTKKLPKNSSCHFDRRISTGSRKLDCESLLAVTKANREAVLMFKCDSHDTEVLALFIYISHVHQKKQECKKGIKSLKKKKMQYICRQFFESNVCEGFSCRCNFHHSVGTNSNSQEQTKGVLFFSLFFK